MTPKQIYPAVSAIGPFLGNHLWQSTLFAVGAGLLAFFLRKNQARMRYLVWLSASLKFLIPFSLLVGFGSHLAWSHPTTVAKPALYVAVEGISDPFTQPAVQIVSRSSISSASHFIHWVPTLIALMWLVGAISVVVLWCVRWVRLSASLQAATPLPEGREVEVLRRIERASGMRKQIELRLSSASLEPGVFGITRPILVWPRKISERLNDTHLEAVLAHEVWHVRRQDNLAAAIHMFIEVLFWFHPLVWWLGARLIEERERACDEQVLRLGNRPQIYAESILKTCEFCLESPLTCVSGVTGADLKKRIARIMSDRIAVNLSAGRKLVLIAVGLTALIGPMIWGIANAPTVQAQATVPDWQTKAGGKQTFDVVSVKQNKSGDPPAGDRPTTNVPFGPGDIYTSTGGLFRAVNMPLREYITFAYKLSYNEMPALLSQLPKWALSDRFDIEARTSMNPTKDQMRLMMQSLLADRFKLAIHMEIRQLPVYGLVLVKAGQLGPQLHQHSEAQPCPTPGNANPQATDKPPMVDGGLPAACNGFIALPAQNPGRWRIGARNIPMSLIAVWVTGQGQGAQAQLDRTVIDKTGLTGTFDLIQEWTPQVNAAPGSNFQPDASGPNFQEALKEQLGLKLDSQTGPIGVLVLDHLDHPSEN